VEGAGVAFIQPLKEASRIYAGNCKEDGKIIFSTRLQDPSRAETDIYSLEAETDCRSGKGRGARMRGMGQGSTCQAVMPSKINTCALGQWA